MHLLNFAGLVHWLLRAIDNADNLAILEHIHKLGADTLATRVRAGAGIRPFKAGAVAQLLIDAIVGGIVENEEGLAGVADSVPPDDRERSGKVGRCESTGSREGGCDEISILS